MQLNGQLTLLIDYYLIKAINKGTITNLMALIGIDYHTTLRDILWDNSKSEPYTIALDAKVCLDLIHIFWIETTISRLVGRPNIATLQRAQEAADNAVTILSNRQATQIDLDEREQVINFNISGVSPTEETPTKFKWVTQIEFKSGNTVQITI